MRVIFLDIKTCIKAILILTLLGSILVVLFKFSDNGNHQSLEQVAHIGPEPQNVPVFKVTGNSTRQLFQISPQIIYSEENPNDVMHELTHRFWSLQSPNKSNQPKNQNFFTEPRLKQLARYNLWKPIMSDGPNFTTSIYGIGDRILAQVVFGMEGLDHKASSLVKTKTIILRTHGLEWLGKKSGNLDKECPEYKLNNCRLVLELGDDGENFMNVDHDLIISTGEIPDPGVGSNFGESKLAYFQLESPYFYTVRIPANSPNRWFSSYWRESDIPTPINMWLHYDNRIIRKPQDTNYAENKSKLAAIFVSNCKASNGRLALVQKLQTFIPIDVYGKCGTVKCGVHSECFEMLRKQYKFYLAFQNANCRDYITEKFFRNALGNDVVPVVFGAHPDDYKAVAPFHSYIHVEDHNSIADLAHYLLYLDSNDKLYNQYFEWKGTGEFFDFTHAKYFCRVCTMLHYNDLVQAPPNTLEEFHWSPGTFCLSPDRPYWNESRSVEFLKDSEMLLYGLLNFIVWVVIVCLILCILVLFVFLLLNFRYRTWK